MEFVLKMGQVICVTLIVLTFNGCERAVTSNQSKFSIHIPAQGFFGKSNVHSLSAPPSNRKACYAINITGPSITSGIADNCSLDTGIVGGFVEAGQSIDLLVPQGDNRKVELFLFLQAVGENLPCPVFGKTMSSTQLLNSYLLSTKSVPMFQSEMTIEMEINFPGAAQNIATQMSFPPSCSLTTLPGFTTSSARGTATGPGLVLRGRVGTVYDKKKLSAAGVNLYVD